jgi:hypothetical protein
MWLAIGLFVFAGIWAISMAFLVLTGGLRTRNGPIIGFQRSPEKMDRMIARAKERQARYDRWRERLR